MSDAVETKDGSVVLMMLGLLVLGVAALFGVTEPASAEWRRTRDTEQRLREEIDREEGDRRRLELEREGLERDPRVVEREQRRQGTGKAGEVRYEPLPESHPR